MKRILIMNAGDLGLSKGQNHGAAEICRNGVVTSTMALVSGTAIDHAIQLNHDIPALTVGIHFVLALGRPLTAVSGLTRNGLLGRWIWQMVEEDTLLLDEVSQELVAQYQRFVDPFGREPTHLDSHHHVHMLPQIFPIVAGFTVEKGIALCIDHQTVFQASDSPEMLHTFQGFGSEFYGEAVSEALFLQTPDAPADREESSLEVIYHPAFIDDTTRQSIYRCPRLTELDVLTSSSLKCTTAEYGYRLGSFPNV